MYTNQSSDTAKQQDFSSYDYTREGIKQGFQMIGVDWRYAYVNETAVKQYGFDSSNDLIGFTVMEKFPGINTTEMFSKLEKAMYEGIACIMEYEFTFPLGFSRRYELRVSPFLFGIVVLSTDITDKKSKRAKDELDKQK